MKCPKCSQTISANSTTCANCGESTLGKTPLEKLKTVPAALLLTLIVAHFVRYIDLDYPTASAFARTIGVNLPPIIVFIIFVLFGQRKMKIASFITSMLFILILITSTLQDAKDRLQ